MRTKEAGGVRGLAVQREVGRCKEVMFSEHMFVGPS